MNVVIDPRLLRTNDLGDRVEGHRKCPKCEYDLIGLEFGGRCPECGTPIQRRGSKRLLRDNMSDAPLAYLRRLHLGCFGLAAMAIALPGFRIATNVGANEGLAAATIVAALLWFAAVWIVTLPRPFMEGMRTNPKREYLVTRILTLGTQGLWILSALTTYLTFVSPGSVLGLMIAGSAIDFVAMLGFIPLAIWLGHLSEWASDTSLATRMHTSAVVIALTQIYIIAAMIASPFLGWIGQVLMLIAFFAAISYLIALIFFIVSLVQLAIMTKWAIRSAINAMERAEQLAEIAAIRAAAAKKVVRVEDELGIEFAEPASKPSPPSFHGHRIDPDDDLDPYDVAPD